MPTLPAQRDVFPDWLLDENPSSAAVGCVASASDEMDRWVAFYTLSRREKDLMRKLESAEIPFYAPLIKRRLQSPAGRTRLSFVPLFPGYVFSRLDDDQRRSALATNTISRWLPIADPADFVADLRNIKRLIEADRPLTPEALLEPGQLVRVRSGALQGLEGTVVRRRGEQRLVVAIRFLNQGASIELEDVDLERL